MSRKYYEHYEDIYKTALAAGVDRYNNPLEGNFGDLFIRSLLPPSGRVLDLGCGEGLYSLLFAAEGYEVVGIDISSSAVEWARRRATEQGMTNAHFRVGDVTTLSDFASGQFDLVLSVHCYHCLSDDKDRMAHLREAWRVLTSEGVFVFDNMAAPLKEDMPQFRVWHTEKDGQVHEDETGVTTTIATTSSFAVHRPAGSEQVKFEIPTAVSLAHRFYSRLEHVLDQLNKVGFGILMAEVRAPDPSRISEMPFIHGDNVIYARKLKVRPVRRPITAWS
ncbi:MAG: class I SAM-dependent methyltransferase [Chloroflexi bacterium]|nr:class I SAM-dependent methyltransferase [Chloroflexota bacterium]